MAKRKQLSKQAASPVNADTVDATLKLEYNGLHSACKYFQSVTRSDDWERTIVKLQNKRRHHAALQGLEKEFLGMLEKFRELATEVVWMDEKKCVIFPLCKTVTLLGIALPKMFGNEIEWALSFEEELGIPENDITFDPDDTDGWLPSTHIPNLVRKAGWHPVIVKRFVSWLETYVAEKIASAPWDLLLY